MTPESAPFKSVPAEPARRAFADPAPSLRAPNPVHRPTRYQLPATGHRLSAERPSDARHPYIRKQSRSTTSTFKSNTYPSPSLLTSCVLRGRNPSGIKFISRPQPMPPQKKIKRLSATNRPRTPAASPSAPCFCSPEKSQPDARRDAGFPIRHPLSAVRDGLSAARSSHHATIRKQSTNTTSTSESNTYASQDLLTRCATETRNPSRIILISCQHPPSPKKEKRHFSAQIQSGEPGTLYPAPCTLGVRAAAGRSNPHPVY